MAGSNTKVPLDLVREVGESRLNLVHNKLSRLLRVTCVVVMRIQCSSHVMILVVLGSKSGQDIHIKASIQLPAT